MFRRHAVLFGENKSIIRALTDTGGIDRVTIHEMLLWLSSDMSVHNCLLMLGFLVRERDGYGSMSELKHNLQDDGCVVGC